MEYLKDRQSCLRIAGLCRDPDARKVGSWKDGHPSRWHPTSVEQPSISEKFTDVSAWEFIADLIETHFVALQIIALEKPPGTEAYEIHTQINGRDLYIKLTLTRTGKVVIGRSFHYSESQQGGSKWLKTSRT